MAQNKKSDVAAEFVVPEGARKSLASFGVTEESGQDDFLRELASGLKRAAEIERAMGLRPAEPDPS